MLSRIRFTHVPQGWPQEFIDNCLEAPPPLLSLRYFQVSWGSLFSSPAYTLLLPQVRLPPAKWQEDQRGKMVNSLPIQWHFKFWSSFPIHLPLFAFQSPQKAAPCTLSRFYSRTQQQQQEGRRSICELELETQSVMFKIFFPLLCVCPQTDLFHLAKKKIYISKAQLSHKCSNYNCVYPKSLIPSGRQYLWAVDASI